MPRGIDLCIPFPSRISPDVDRARDRHLDWPRSFGLLDTEEARRRHARAMYAELGALFQPLAVGDDLDLSVDQMSWYFLFDDSFDGPRRAIGPARELVDAHVAVLDHPPGRDAEPIVCAFADLWRRSQEGMSSTWRARAAHHWRRYLTGHLWEAANRLLDRRLSIADYLRLRRRTVGAQPVLDMAERCGHFEVPERLFADEHLTAMRTAVVEITIVQNDLCSVEKETVLGDLNNIVLILEHELSCSRTRAVELAADMVRQRSKTYLALERRLPEFDLAPDERAVLERYAADGMRPLARGSYEWSEMSGRYAERDRPTIIGAAR